MFYTELIPHQDILFGEDNEKAQVLGAVALTAAQVLLNEQPRQTLFLVIRDPQATLTMDKGKPVLVDGVALQLLTSGLEAQGLNLFAGNGAALEIIVRMNKPRISRVHVNGDQVKDLDRDKRGARIQQRALHLAEGYR